MVKLIVLEHILIFVHKIGFRYWDVKCLYVHLDLTTILPGWAVQNRFCSTLTRYSPVQQLRTLTPWTLLAPLLIYQFHKQGAVGWLILDNFFVTTWCIFFIKNIKKPAGQGDSFLLFNLPSTAFKFTMEWDDYWIFKIFTRRQDIVLSHISLYL